MKKTRGVALVALAATSALMLAACGGGGGGGQDASKGGVFADCKAAPNTCNSAAADKLQQGGQITYVIEKNIANFFLISNDGNVADPSNALRPTLPWTFGTSPDLKVYLNKNLLTSAEQTSASPQTVVYKIRPEAKWSDGTPISADDFIFGWKYQDATTCPDCAPASTGGFDQLASVVGSDGGKTVTATFKTPYTDWKSLWGTGSPLYPAHIAKQQGDYTTAAGLKAAETYFGKTPLMVSGGPYMIQKWEDNVALTDVPNPAWYGATKPKLERVVFRVITDATQSPIALQNNEVQVIYPQPQVDLVSQVGAIPGVSQTQSLGLSWEHIDFNLKSPFLAAKPLRQALATAVNRQAMIDKTVGQFNKDVKPLNSTVLLPGQEGFSDNMGANKYGSGDVEAAKKVLTDAGYKGVGTKLVAPDGQAVPTLRMRYTTGNAIRQSQSEIFVAAAKQLGVDFQIVTLDKLGQTLSKGDFDAIVYAFVASPFPFSSALQNFQTTSPSNFSKYANPEIDTLLTAAASSTDGAAALAKLNQADKIILGDVPMLPLYQKPTYIAVRNNIANARDNPTLDGPTYNLEEWGIRTG